MINSAEAIANLLDTALERFVPDKMERQRIASDLAAKRIDHVTKVMLADAQGESWLQRNWRPGLMVWFAFLIGLHWFGLTPENISQESLNSIFFILELGLGVYIGGRTIEKTARIIKGQEASKDEGLITKIIKKRKARKEAANNFETE